MELDDYISILYNNNFYTTNDDKLEKKTKQRCLYIYLVKKTIS